MGPPNMNEVSLGCYIVYPHQGVLVFYPFHKGLNDQKNCLQFQGIHMKLVTVLP